MRPPAVSTPCVGAWRSTTSSAIPSSMSASPPQLGLSTENPYRASTRQTAPSAPGSTTPGWSTSKMSPTIPSRNSRLIRSGLMIVLRKRVMKPGLTVSICAPARCRV